MRGGQKVAVLVAVSGVLYLTLSRGELPWIALTLAFTFGIYGLIRKQIDLSGLQGFCLEMTLIAGGRRCSYCSMRDKKAAECGLTAAGRGIALLLGTGVASAIPLVSFGAAARLIPLSSLGLMQYLAPSTQFLLGVFLYKEPFTLVELVGYAIIWSALLLFSLEGVLHTRRSPRMGYVG